jgi:two-component system chemotaxis response regulator CheY
VVDDNAEARELIAAVLARDGFRVREATNGGDALEVLAEIDDVPCLAIVDLMMPVLDGQRFVERLRQVRKDIPVIVVTGSKVESIPGVHCVIPKPLDPDDLRVAVRAAAG